MVKVIMDVTSEEHDPEADAEGSAQDVVVDVTVEGGSVETVVVVWVDTELDTSSDVPKRVAVGVGVQAILDTVCAVEDEMEEGKKE
jgi:hypothetical protein